VLDRCFVLYSCKAEAHILFMCTWTQRSLFTDNCFSYFVLLLILQLQFVQSRVSGIVQCTNHCVVFYRSDTIICFSLCMVYRLVYCQINLVQTRPNQGVIWGNFWSGGTIHLYHLPISCKYIKQVNDRFNGLNHARNPVSTGTRSAPDWALQHHYWAWR